MSEHECPTCGAGIRIETSVAREAARDAEIERLRGENAMYLAERDAAQSVATQLGRELREAQHQLADQRTATQAAGQRINTLEAALERERVEAPDYYMAREGLQPNEVNLGSILGQRDRLQQQLEEVKVELRAVRSEAVGKLDASAAVNARMSKEIAGLEQQLKEAQADLALQRYAREVAERMIADARRTPADGDTKGSNE